MILLATALASPVGAAPTGGKPAFTLGEAESRTKIAIAMCFIAELQFVHKFRTDTLNTVKFWDELACIGDSARCLRLSCRY